MISIMIYDPFHLFYGTIFIFTLFTYLQYFIYITIYMVKNLLKFLYTHYCHIHYFRIVASEAKPFFYIDVAMMNHITTSSEIRFC